MQHYQLAALIMDALIKSNEYDKVVYNKEGFLALSNMNDVEVDYMYLIDESGQSGPIASGLRFLIDDKTMDFDWHEWNYEEDDYSTEKAWSLFIEKCKKFYCMFTPIPESLPLKRQRLVTVMPKEIRYIY